jgi:hypothetical protein
MAGPFYGLPNFSAWAVPAAATPCGPNNGGSPNGRAAAYETLGIQVGLADGSARTILGNGVSPYWSASLDPLP